MHTMFHCLDVLCINTYILHKEMCKRPEVEETDNGHKECLLDLIDSHVRRSITIHNTQQLKIIQTTAVSAATIPRERLQFSNINPSLSQYDKFCYSGQRSDHHQIKAREQDKYVYCWHLLIKTKQDAIAPSKGLTLNRPSTITVVR